MNRVIFKSRVVNIGLVLGLIFWLTSCGFQLKGSNNHSLNLASGINQNIELIETDHSYVAIELKKILGISESNQDAIYKISLNDEKLETDIISYDNLSEPNGYEVRLSLSYQIYKNQDGKRQILYSEQLESLDYLFTEDGDSLSEINQLKMKELVDSLAQKLSEKIYSRVLSQFNLNQSNNQSNNP